MIDKAKVRAELEHYFAAGDDLYAKYQGGQLERVTFLVFRDGLQRRLSERCYFAYVALERAKTAMSHSQALVLDPASEERLEVLLLKDAKSYKTWVKAYARANVRRAAFQMLELLADIEIPPVPEPTTEALASWEKAYNHRLGPSKGVPLTAEQLNRSAPVSPLPMTEEQKRRNRAALTTRVNGLG